MVNKTTLKDMDGSLARLNRQLRLLEIEHEKKLQKLKVTNSVGSNEFLELCKKLNNTRRKDELKVNEELEDIEKNVKNLTSLFKDRDQLENADEEQLSSKVVNTSRNIFTMKDSLQIELKQLQSEENRVIQDLNAKYKEVDEFAKSQGYKNNNIFLKHKLKAAIDVYKKSSYQSQEVKKFQKYLDEFGGHYGGWKEEDHLLFLKVSSKHKPHKTAEIIHQQLPDKKLEDVLKHEEWYKKYISLREEKKKSIELWKLNHKEQTSHVGILSDKSKSFVFKRDPNEKIKIEQWKTEQQLKKEKELEEIEIKHILKQKEDDEKKKMLEHQRDIIKKCIQEKRNCELAVALAHKEQEIQEAQQKALKANNMLKQFRLEDRKYTERIKARKSSLKSEEEVSIKSLVTAERDPERLLKPTQVWIQRTKKSKPEDETQSLPSHSMFILQVPHLGKPAWRKGLSS